MESFGKKSPLKNFDFVDFRFETRWRKFKITCHLFHFGKIQNLTASMVADDDVNDDDDDKADADIEEI